jgi:hypothetical protein
MPKIPANEDVNESTEVTLRKNSEWRVIDEARCLVIDFIPFSSIENGKVVPLDRTTPYASLVLECKKFPTRITGFITHKIDFMHLWIAFRERSIKEDEEVNIFWSKRHYKNILYKVFSAFMPKLWVMVCPKGAFKLSVDPNYKPEITGEARFKATRPIIDWKPEVME